MRTLLGTVMLACRTGGLRRIFRAADTEGRDARPRRPSNESDEHDLEGYSPGVVDYYGETHEHGDDEAGSIEAEYHQPPKPAEAGLGETIELTGTEIGVRFDVTVTDVKPVEDDLMAVFLKLKSTGIAIYERPMEQAAITYPGETGDAARHGGQAPSARTASTTSCASTSAAAAAVACCSRGPATSCPSASSSRSRSFPPRPAGSGTCSRTAEAAGLPWEARAVLGDAPNGVLVAAVGSRAIIGGVLAVLALVAIIVPGGASGGDDTSQPYPTRQLAIMAPAAAGGGWDTTARAFQSASQDEGLDDGLEVFNVEGAGGTLGLSELVSKSSGDPYQLMMTGLVMLGAIETNGSDVPITRTTPIATLITETEGIVVPADSKYRSFKELADDLKARPGLDPVRRRLGGLHRSAAPG